MKNKKYLNTFLASTVAASMVSPQMIEAAQSNKMNDISKSYAKSNIEYLTSKGIVAGVSAGRFAPLEEMDRQTFAALLGKTMGLQEKSQGSSYTDVAPWAQGIIGALEEKNLVSGYSKTKFGAKDPVTREQMAVFYVRAFGFEDEAKKLNLPLNFKDAKDVSPWARPLVAFAEKVGFIGGYPDGTFKPKKSSLRQDVAALSYRYIDPENTDANIVEGGVVKENKYITEINKLIKEEKPPTTETPGKEPAEEPVKAPVVESIKPLEDIIVIKGATYALPENVITVYTDGKEKEMAVTWDTKNVDVNVLGTYEVSGTIQGTTLKAKINITVKTDSVTVTNVTVNSATELTIELNKELSAGEILTILKDGTPIDGKNVKVDKKALKATIPALEDEKEYTITILNQEGKELYNKSEKFDLKIPVELVTKPVGYTKQVGEKVSVHYGILDEDGSALPGVKVRIQVQYYDKLEQKNKVIEDIVVSDNNGDIFYEYTSFDVRRDTINAIAVDRPAEVRNEGNITVDWALAKSGLVEVDQPKDIDLGAGTYRDYTVSFKDEAKNPIPKGTKVYVYLGENASASTKLKGDFTKVVGTENYAEATVNNFEGKAILSVTDETDKTIKPLFYYDLKKDNQSYKEEANDPRVQAGATMYKKQIPTFILNDKKPGKIATGDKKVVELEVIDQFENPYLGIVKVGLEEAMDNINETKYGAIKFDLDIDRNGDGANASISEQENKTDAVNINFGARIASGDLEKSVVDIIVKDGLDKEKATLAVFYDENGNGFDELDKKESLPLEFEKLTIKEIMLESSQDVIAEGNEAFFTVSFKDQNGKPIALDSTRQSDIAFEVLDQAGNVVSNFKAPEHHISLESDIESYKKNEADFAEGTDYGDTLSYNAQETYEQFIVKFTSDTAGTYSLRAYLDDYVGSPVPVPNQSLQVDELSATKQIIVEGPILTSGRINNSANYSLNNEVESFRYILQDQDGQAFTAKKDETVIYTFTNDGDADIQVEDQNGVKHLVKAGQTTAINAKVIIGESSYIMKATPTTKGDASMNLSAQIKGIPNSASLSEINWMTIDKDMSAVNGNDDIIYNGTVVAFKQKIGTANGWYVLKTSVGSVLIQYATETDMFAVDKNSDSKGDAFNEQVTVGDKVTWEYNGATQKQKHDLENK